MKEVSSKQEQQPEITDVVEAGTAAYRQYVTRQEQLRERSAQEIVERGGETERDPFLYAIHGILPDVPHTDLDKRVLAAYQRIEDKFYPGCGGQPFVRLRQFEDIPPDVDDAGVIAVPPVDQDGKRISPLHYRIEPGMSGYDGLITVPVTQYHIAPHPIGLEREEDCSLVVARATSEPYDEDSTGITSYRSEFIIGLNAIYRARTMGEPHEQNGDDNYVDIVRTLRNAAHGVQEQFALERQQAEALRLAEQSAMLKE